MLAPSSVVTPNIDLFASRINCQITPYISYRAEPAAYAINAFHMLWQHHLSYALPPFSLITRVLQKIQEEKATGLLLVPKWPTQPWWPKLMQMLIQLPIQLPRDRDTLFLPSNPQEPHPLHKNCVWFYVTCPEIPQWQRPFDDSYQCHGTILEMRH